MISYVDGEAREVRNADIEEVQDEEPEYYEAHEDTPAPAPLNIERDMGFDEFDAWVRGTVGWFWDHIDELKAADKPIDWKPMYKCYDSIDKWAKKFGHEEWLKRPEFYQEEIVRTKVRSRVRAQLEAQKSELEQQEKERVDAIRLKKRQALKRPLPPEPPRKRARVVYIHYRFIGLFIRASIALMRCSNCPSLYVVVSILSGRLMLGDPPRMI